MADLNELKQRSSKNADFIVSADIDNRLNLLPYADFLKKYSTYSKEEKLLLLFEFEELFNRATMNFIDLNNIEHFQNNIEYLHTKKLK